MCYMYAVDGCVVYSISINHALKGTQKSLHSHKFCVQGFVCYILKLSFIFHRRPNTAAALNKVDDCWGIISKGWVHRGGMKRNDYNGTRTATYIERQRDDRVLRERSALVKFSVSCLIWRGFSSNRANNQSKRKSDGIETLIANIMDLMDIFSGFLFTLRRFYSHFILHGTTITWSTWQKCIQQMDIFSNNVLTFVEVV